jgi:hypothetical protein
MRAPGTSECNTGAVRDPCPGRPGRDSTMRDLRPLDHIDRTAEQELFVNLTTYQTPARILTVCDHGGRGKSSLLKRLRYNCQHEIKPPVPSCLLELDKLSDPSAFNFAQSVVDGFAVRGEDISKCFAKFNQLNDARLAKDFTPFEDDSRTLRTRDPRVIGRAEAKTMYGGTNAGVYVEGDYHEAPAPEFTEDQDKRARDRCVDALFDDLRSICATRPMVLMLDGWERCNLPLRDWIFEEMLGNHVLNLEPGLRPNKLAIVIAGRPHVPGQSPYGLRDDEFRALFDSDVDFAECVLSVKSLSKWENKHIREFMVINGYPEPTDDDVNFIRGLLLRGRSLEKIVSLIEEYLQPSPAAGAP